MKKLADPVFKAIADPTRREIIDLLARSECSVKQLTTSFDLSQPAVSQHLRQLRASKLVTAEKVGLDQHYRLTASPFVGAAEIVVALYQSSFKAHSPEALVFACSSRPKTPRNGDQRWKATYRQAVDHGAIPVWPAADMFWGDRRGWRQDPFGHMWALCTVIAWQPWRSFVCVDRAPFGYGPSKRKQLSAFADIVNSCPHSDGWDILFLAGLSHALR